MPMNFETFAYSKDRVVDSDPSQVLLTQAAINYVLTRSNGTFSDMPSRAFPADGQYTVEKTDNGSLVRYSEGPQDAAWQAERDLNYVQRLAKIGRLQAITDSLQYLPAAHKYYKEILKIYNSKNGPVAQEAKIAAGYAKQFERLANFQQIVATQDVTLNKATAALRTHRAFLDQMSANTAEAAPAAAAPFQRGATSESFPWKAISGLIADTAACLEPFRATKKPAVIFLGPTGSGITTLSNAANGIDYLTLLETEAEQLVSADVYEVVNPAGHTANTETTYPYIQPKDDDPYCTVDLPPFNHTGGQAYRIAAAFAATRLVTCFTELKTLAVVCLKSQIFDNPRDQSFQNLLKMLAEIIGQDKERLKNVVLIVNKADATTSPDSVMVKIGHILKSNPDWSATLRHLNPGQILVVDGDPGEEFRQAFLQRVMQNKPKPLSEFNFQAYSLEWVECQKQLKILLDNQDDIDQEERCLAMAQKLEAEAQRDQLSQALDKGLVICKEIETFSASTNASIGLVINNVYTDICGKNAQLETELISFRQVIEQLENRTKGCKPNSESPIPPDEMAERLYLLREKRRATKEIFSLLVPVLQYLPLERREIERSERVTQCNATMFAGSAKQAGQIPPPAREITHDLHQTAHFC